MYAMPKAVIPGAQQACNWCEVIAGKMFAGSCQLLVD